jgi:LacI family transcriptional regulator
MPLFTLLEPLSTFETSAVAEELTEKLLSEHADLRGLFVAGGGISGVMQALRTTHRAGQVVTVGHQLMDNTRIGLLDGTLTMVLDDPMEELARQVLAAMHRATKSPAEVSAQTIILPFTVCTRENI